MLHLENLDGIADPAKSTAERIAEVIIANSKNGQPTMDEEVQALFSADEIAAHGPAALRIALRRIHRDIRDDVAHLPYDETARIEKAANLIAGIMLSDNGTIIAKLRENSFTARELGRLYPRILERVIALIALANCGAAS